MKEIDGLTKMKQLVMGILAHVDAGKTTLSEALLYQNGAIRKWGRVDKKDSFLDQYSQERERGITIFSKQARFHVKEFEITLLDTPGHVDFSAEMERTLSVLDVAVLVVSALEGVQSHTLTLWKLLKRYQVPTFLFLNKMDMSHHTKEELMKILAEKLDGNCVLFENMDSDAFAQNIAMCDEEAMNDYLERGRIEKEKIKEMISRRILFPCYFGSALKMQGVEELLHGIIDNMKLPQYGVEFGARVFKITNDAKGNRLTHLKITGGTIGARSFVTVHRKEGDSIREKINEIRCYSGEKYELVPEAKAGEICAVSGLTETFIGQGLGFEADELPVLEPILSYGVYATDGSDISVIMEKLKKYEEEEPLLHVKWNEETKEIKVQVMGAVQIEILEKLLKERYDIGVRFDKGTICYRETIQNRVEGVGHYEPLRHYAEVHLLMEPGEPGSGVVCETDCRDEVLERNWQRLILTHLYEKEHVGVLIGAPVTDIHIVLKSGRAHLKHTEGGDFRQATYRAVRQGLMEAKSCILEPYYEFVLEVPENCVGRAMTDLECRSAKFELTAGRIGTSVLKGKIPLSTIEDYGREVLSYTKGMGIWSCTYLGYFPCHAQEEVMQQFSYEAEHDVSNPADSVFCAHGAGMIIPWYEVKKHMHLESCLKEKGSVTETLPGKPRISEHQREVLGTEEIDEILIRAAGANRKEHKNQSTQGWKRAAKTVTVQTAAQEEWQYRPQKKKEKYILVDGYNVVFAWKELNELAKVSLDGARGRLQDILCNYQAIVDCPLIVVFDAYRLGGHPTEILDYHNIHVVFTREAETADQYIERFAHENAKKYDITVVTSDGLEQMIILGQGCVRRSAREFEKEVLQVTKENLEAFYQRPQN